MSHDETGNVVSDKVQAHRDVPVPAHQQAIQSGPPAPAESEAVPEVMPAPEPTSTERQEALFSHVGGYFLSFVLPLVFLLSKRNKSRFVALHAREALNFQITIGLAWIAITLLAVFGGALWWLAAEHAGVVAVSALLWGVLGAILGLWETAVVIIASLAAYRGRPYYYPLCLRLVP
jgi:uncharacterized Tic20 family protein